jgi:chitinase
MFVTYVTTWNYPGPLAVIEDMISKSVLTKNSLVLLAFASFNFSSTDYIPGFENITLDDVKNIVNLIHNANGKIGLSIGGATYKLYNSDLYDNPGLLASNINTIIKNCGFDAVDFDIEDSYSSVDSNFAIQSASLINTLRNLNNNLIISYTCPAQAWAIGMYQQQLINLTIGNLTYWAPMEYDLWIDTSSNYYDQIQYDINFYINTWGINPNKIILGLMPGKDDISHDLTLQDTLNLCSFSLNKGLFGLMTWDINIDSDGIDGNAPYSYSMGIQSILNKSLKSQIKYGINRELSHDFGSNIEFTKNSNHKIWNIPKRAKLL